MSPDYRMNDTPRERKTIVFAEVLTEVDCFSPITTTKRDFEADCLLYGEDIIAHGAKEKSQLAGFLKAVEEFGDGKVDVIPILKARATPGGPERRTG